MSAGTDETWRRPKSEDGPAGAGRRIKGEQLDETTSILDQRHSRRLLPSRGGDGPRRGVDALLDRTVGTSRCPASRPGDLRDDGVGVAAPGDGHVARLDG